MISIAPVEAGTNPRQTATSQSTSCGLVLMSISNKLFLPRPKGRDNSRLTGTRPHECTIVSRTESNVDSRKS